MSDDSLLKKPLPWKSNFPSEKQFTRWWVGKSDRLVTQRRSSTCPITRYLREHGYPQALVGFSSWSSMHGELATMPRWAQRLREKFDRQMRG